ncbi:MAG: phosphoribosylformylglycinamidine synthase subunit PurQ [Deltaproteobacteria bacterium]|nr:phosphoribosylformylglycinamidine synthase subunit PurQ [Deltaproteobacteria bacterium]
MAKAIRAIVITGNGTNCEMEMAHACRLAGFDQVEIVHISELLCGTKKLDDYDFLNLPGGFLDGDDLGSAKAGANRILHAPVAGTNELLFAQFTRFIGQGKLILGVCNGFQLLVKLGMLPGFDSRYDRQSVTLTYNDSGRFEDRWVRLTADPASPCIFTRGISGLSLPVRHGEGKFIAQDPATLKRLQDGHLISLRYADGQGQPTQSYPANPNGSVDAIAGISDATGRIFGLMPHPEAFLHRTNHPRWTREDLPEEGAGLALFRNAAGFLRSHSR